MTIATVCPCGRSRGLLSIALVVTVCISAQASAQSLEQTTNPAPSASSLAPVKAVPSVSGADLFTIKPSRAVTDLFAPLPGDFKQMVSPQNWLVAGIGTAAAVAFHPLDAQIATQTWPAGAAPIMSPGTIVGGFEVQTAAALAIYITGRANDSSRTARLGAALFRAQLVSQTTAQILKLASNRTRPDGTSLSFPSGHSASMFATATVLQSEFGWKAGVPAYAAAAWVAASRVQGNRHYLSDVIAGATLGILAGRSVTVGTGNTRFALGPMAVPGGMGVSFTKVPRH
jgi:membrane-associated phospholipid phosphatase